MSMIYKAKHNDLQEILQLQYLYYRWNKAFGRNRALFSSKTI